MPKLKKQLPNLLSRIAGAAMMGLLRVLGVAAIMLGHLPTAPVFWWGSVRYGWSQGRLGFPPDITPPMRAMSLSRRFLGAFANGLLIAIAIAITFTIGLPIVFVGLILNGIDTGWQLGIKHSYKELLYNLSTKKNPYPIYRSLYQLDMRPQGSLATRVAASLLFALIVFPIVSSVRFILSFTFQLPHKIYKDGWRAAISNIFHRYEAIFFSPFIGFALGFNQGFKGIKRYTDIEDKKDAIVIQHRFENSIKNKTSLNLADANITSADIPEIIKFLDANPEITSLNLTGNTLRDADIELLAKNNKTITTLILCLTNLSAQAVGLLALHNKVVTDVNLSHNDQIGVIGARAFARENKVIKKVHLGNCNLGDDGLVGFAEENKIATELNFTANNISATGLIGFAEKNQCINLVSFSQNNNIALNGFSGFAEKNRVVTIICFSHCNLNSDAVILFMEKNSTVVKADFSYNYIQKAGRIAEKNRCVTSINLSNNKLTDRDLLELALNNETALIVNFDNNRHITGKGIVDFFKNNHSVTIASFSGVALNYNQCLNIAKSNKMITKISLTRAKINDRGALELVRNNEIATDVDLSFNNVSNQGVKDIFCQNKVIEKLSLCGNKIRNSGAVTIAKYNQTIQEVDLSNNRISDYGAMALTSTNNSHFNYNLRGNSIGIYVSEYFYKKYRAQRVAGIASSLVNVMKELKVDGSEAFDPLIPLICEYENTIQFTAKVNPGNVLGSINLFAQNHANPDLDAASARSNNQVRLL